MYAEVFQYVNCLSDVRNVGSSENAKSRYAVASCRRIPRGNAQKLPYIFKIDSVLSCVWSSCNDLEACEVLTF